VARAQAGKAEATPDAALAADAAAEVAPVAAPRAAEEPEAPVASNAASDQQGFAAEPPPAPAATTATARKHATYTSAARATAEHRERAPAAATPAPPAPAAAAEQDSTTLDRIEVTGARRGDTQSSEPLAKVSVKEDVRLESGEWLERIRARRDAGDLDGARASLRLFRRDHPRVRIPDDLRVLLADPKQ
jgi:hypothetical protein